MNMNRVFVIQDVHGKNLLPAKEHGALEVILSGRENPQDAEHKLRESLCRMTDQDFLLLIGSPLNIALASHIALSLLEGKINFLVWDRIHYIYQLERIELHEDRTAADIG